VRYLSTTLQSIAPSQGVAIQFGTGSAALPSISFIGDSNTGIYSPAADTIAFSEGGVEAMRIDSSANLQFNSGYGSVATAFGCRAWVNFNGTGAVAIRASGNVSSITDNGTGLYTVNLTNAMPDVNYAIVFGNQEFGTSNNQIMNVRSGVTITTSVFGIATYSTTSPQDLTSVYVAIFR
jgi:hypothetical protein